MITKKDLRFLLGIIALVILFFHKILFFGKTFFIGDIMRWFQPLTQFGAEGIQKGYVYLWNPYLSNGEPFVANIQTAVFYPLKILFYLFPFIWAFKLYVVIHFIIAGVFFYLFLRQFSLIKGASFLGSLLFTFGGWLVVHIEYFSVIGSAVWFIGIWVLWQKALKTEKMVYYMITASALAVQFYAGYTFIFYYTAVFLLLFQLWQRRFSLKFIWMWALVAGLISLQLFPTYELMKQSIRASWTFQETSTWSLPPLFLIKFFLPELFGKACLPLYFQQPFGIEYYAIRQYWLTTFYLGIFPLLFLLFAWKKSFAPALSFWKVVALLSLILAMTASIPLTSYYYRFMPLAKSFTHPATFMFFFIVVLIIFIARGCHIFFTAEYAANWKRLKIACIILISTWIAGYTLLLQKKALLYFVQHAFAYALAEKQLQWIEIQFFRFMVSGVIGLSLLVLLQKYRRNSNVWALSLGVVIAELFMFSGDLNPLVSHTFFTTAPANAAMVRNHLGEGRLFVEPEMHMTPYMASGTPEENYFSIRRALHMNVALSYHLPYVYEYGYLTVKSYKDLLLKVRDLHPAAGSKIIDILGGKIILSYKELSLPKLRPLESDFIRIYENKDALPFSWVAGKEKYVLPEQSLAYVADGQFNPKEEVIFTHPGTLKRAPLPSSANGEAEVSTTVIPNGFQSAVRTNFPGWLVLNDIYYPGWQAYLSGKRTPVVKANYILKAIAIPAGKHFVRWSYTPLPFYLGLVITMLTMIVINIGLIARRNSWICRTFIGYSK